MVLLYIKTANSVNANSYIGNLSMIIRRKKTQIYLVLTSNLHLPIIHDNSNIIGNHPRKNMRWASCKFALSSHWCSMNCCWLFETYVAQSLISRIASIDISGKAVLHANSDKHLIASWNESNALPNSAANTVAKKLLLRNFLVYALPILISQLFQNIQKLTNYKTSRRKCTFDNSFIA